MSSANKNNNVNVFVRFRPLVGSELERGDDAIDYSVTPSKKDSALRNVTFEVAPPPLPELAPSEVALAAPIRTLRSKVYKSGLFADVLDASADNEETYARAVAPMVNDLTTCQSAAGCVFCYGHTGSGKTHTVLGYRGEAGIYNRAAAHMLGEASEHGGFLQVQLVEIYNERCRDLLRDGAEVSIRQGPDGAFHLRGATQHLEKGVNVQPLSRVDCHTADDLDSVVRVAQQHRAIGSSGVHDESSRSHAVLVLEVVDETLNTLRDAVLAAEGDKVYWGKFYDDNEIFLFGKMFEKVGWRWVRTDYQPDTVKQAALKADLDAAIDRLRAAEQAVADYTAECRAKGLCVGSRLVLCDLAGNEHGVGGATPQQRKEGAYINKSLLALKECIRKNRRSHLPYRDSALTKVLRDHLEAGCGTVMVATVSPSVVHAVSTGNTLKYATLVSQ